MNASQCALQFAIEEIERLEPGQRVEIGRSVLREIGSASLVPGVSWSPAERIMENIVSSAYKFRFWNNDRVGSVTFERLEKPLAEPGWMSPDRRRETCGGRA